MCEQQKTWHILGAGAIGSLWATRLHQAGVPVSLILSPRRMASHLGPTVTIRVRELSVTGAKRIQRFDLPISHADDKIHNVLVATKANDVVSALQSVRNSIHAQANIATLSNGMGYHETVATDFPKAAVLPITTTEGAYVDRQNTIVLAGKGQSKIAQLESQTMRPRDFTKEMAKRLSVPGHRLQFRADCQRLLLDKLLINACINGLTAIHTCKNGELYASEERRNDLQNLIMECQAIARAYRQTALANALPGKVWRVIKATAENYSSTYTDIANGRVSEIEYMNGFLLELAKRCKTAAPANQAVVDAVRVLENRD